MDQPLAETPRIKAGIASLTLSGVSILAFIFVLVYGAPISISLTCLSHQPYPGGQVGLLCLTPLYLSSLLALILSFVARYTGRQKDLVLIARIIAPFLLSIYLVLSPLLFALLYWFDAPVPC